MSKIQPEKIEHSEKQVARELSGPPRSAEQMALDRQAAADRARSAQIEALLARVDVLESAVSRLQGLTGHLKTTLNTLRVCTVQQYADGRLYFPAGNLLTIELAGYPFATRMTLDVARCRMEAPRPLTAGPPRPDERTPGLPGLVTTSSPNRPVTPQQPANQGGQAPAGQSLQGMAGKSNDWRSIAEANGIENPTRMTPNLSWRKP